MWTPELHLSFEEAVSTLGLAKARPLSILALMCEKGGAPSTLTTVTIKKHLSLYRVAKRAPAPE